MLAILELDREWKLMGRKLGFTSFFSRTSHATSPYSSTARPWPSCAQPKPKTLSFMLENDFDEPFFDLVELSSSSSCLSEAVARGVRSERLFFEPWTAATMLPAAFEGDVAVEVDSDDPYRDFKQSMEEMLMAHGVRDWAWLEEMLRWYLEANGKSTHGIIVAAFVEILLDLIALPSSSPSSSLRS
ncbi:hypothetical protein ZIOFF_036149 [Zingiber officinale]|uniref:Transcription repressor n=2 Tax=Zingiber officinale TaxID=94328 RepID=A0A8J5GDG6_ZINOF|nr:hypothetical protein ZIOFF_036149 [Zingiber officinale]